MRVGWVHRGEAISEVRQSAFSFDTEPARAEAMPYVFARISARAGGGRTLRWCMPRRNLSQAVSGNMLSFGNLFLIRPVILTFAGKVVREA